MTERHNMPDIKCRFMSSVSPTPHSAVARSEELGWMALTVPRTRTLNGGPESELQTAGEPPPAGFSENYSKRVEWKRGVHFTSHFTHCCKYIQKLVNATSLA